MSYTKGPWKVQNNSHEKWGQIRVDSPDGAVADCGINRFPVPDLQTMLANANLCAAAPELYEFAKIVQSVIENPSGVDFKRLKDMADYALQKAEGRNDNPVIPDDEGEDRALEKELASQDKDFAAEERAEKFRKTWHKNNVGRTDGTKGSRSR